MENKVNPGHFGGMVIGAEQAKKEQEVLERGENIFGSMVVGEAEAEKGLAEQQESEITLSSIADLKAALKKHPDAFDAMLDAEFMRDGGPRHDALKVFRKVERAADEPRDAVLERIAKALGEAEGEPTAAEREAEEEARRVAKREAEKKRGAELKRKAEMAAIKAKQES